MGVSQSPQLPQQTVESFDGRNGGWSLRCQYCQGDLDSKKCNKHRKIHTTIKPNKHLFIAVLNVVALCIVVIVVLVVRVVLVGPVVPVVVHVAVVAIIVVVVVVGDAYCLLFIVIAIVMIIVAVTLATLTFYGLRSSLRSGRATTGHHWPPSATSLGHL